MPSSPVGPGSIQPPLNTGESDKIQKQQDESGLHGHRKVSSAEPEARVLVRPRTSPQKQKKLADFSRIKPVTPEAPQVKQTKTPAPGPVKELPPSPQQEGLDIRQGDSRYQSREDIIRSGKRNKTWQLLEKQIKKKDGTTSKKGFKKLVKSMPKMDFSNKRVVSMLALFAIDKFDSGKFTEAQMREYMGAFMTGYTQAKADEQINQAMLMLPPPPKKGKTTVGHSLNRAAVLAEIAAMTSEKSKGEDATATAFKNMKTDLQADLYDRDSQFLADLTASLEPRVVEINRKVAAGMEREMKRLMAEESGSKKRKLSPQLQETMIKDADLMVQQFVESQLREKKQKIDQYAAEGRTEDLNAITEAVVRKAHARRAGMIEVLIRNAGPGLKEAFEQHTVPESQRPEQVLGSWLVGNGTKTAEQSVKTETVAVEQNSDEPVRELEVWANQLLQLVPPQYRTEVDVEELQEALGFKAMQLDISEGLMQSRLSPSPFSRNDPLRRPVKRHAPNSFAPAKPKTVTETLDQAIKKELAKRAARRAEKELQDSRLRPEEPVPVSETSATTSTKTSGEVQKVPDEAVEKTQTEDSQPVQTQDTQPAQTEEPKPKSIRTRRAQGDGVVPKLVRQFEKIVEHEKQQMERDSRAATLIKRSRGS